MKPQIHNTRFMILNQTHNRGFTLLELIVAGAIITMTTVWSIPEFRRGVAQAQVDRYTRNVESGLFSFKAKMGALKESCKIDFGNIPSFQTGEFMDALTMLEQQTFLDNNESKRSTSDPLYRCNYNNEDIIDMVSDSIYVSDQDAAIKRVQEVAASVQLAGQLNSKEGKKVNVASTAKTYSFTPPGTSINPNSMTLLIQSMEAKKTWAEKSDGTSRLRTRCIEVSGNGQVFSGTWTKNTCQKDQFSLHSQ